MLRSSRQSTRRCHRCCICTLLTLHRMTLPAIAAASRWHDLATTAVVIAWCGANHLPCEAVVRGACIRNVDDAGFLLMFIRPGQLLIRVVLANEIIVRFQTQQKQTQSPQKWEIRALRSDLGSCFFGSCSSGGDRENRHRPNTTIIGTSQTPVIFQIILASFVSGLKNLSSTDNISSSINCT